MSILPRIIHTLVFLLAAIPAAILAKSAYTGFNPNPLYQTVLYGGATGPLIWVAAMNLRYAAAGIKQATIDRMRLRPFVRKILRQLPGMLASSGMNAEWEGGSFGKKGWIKDGEELYSQKFFEYYAAIPFRTTLSSAKNTIIVLHERENNEPSSIEVQTRLEDGSILTEKLTKNESLAVQIGIDRWRRRQLGTVLGCSSARDALAVTAVLHSIDGHSQGIHPVGKGGNIVLIKIGKDHWIHAIGVGPVKMNREDMKYALAHKRDTTLAAAFGIQSEIKAQIPPLLGNPTAAKEISVAQRLIEAYPDMTDLSGTPIAPLVQDHLPRLVSRHAAALAAATATNKIDEDQLQRITQELEEGLAVISRAVIEGVEKEQERTQSDLSSEIGFLRLRHPQDLFAVTRKRPEPHAFE